MELITRLISAEPRVSALVFGLFAALGFPPLGLWPIALVGIAGLVWLIWQAPTWRKAFGLGWLFGFSHFTLTNNWIATAFTFQSDLAPVIGWYAVPLLGAVLAFFPALAAGLAYRFMGASKSLASLSFLFAATWVLAEWLRSWVFTGYGWGPLSLALLGPHDRAGLANLLPFFGTYALSGLVVLIGCALLGLVLARRWIVMALGVIAVTGGMFWPAPPLRESELAVTLVQPDIRQEVLDDPSNFEDQFIKLARQTRRSPSELGADFRKRLVVWPESGLPDYLRPGYPQRYYTQMTAGGDPDFARFRVGQVIGEGSMLLTGAIDLEIGTRDGRPAAIGAYNAITPIGADGSLGERYAKSHLVPFGEYLPFRWALEPLGLSRFVAGTLDFIPGPGAQTRDLGEYGKAGMQICYEIVFSGEVVDPANRPDYIYNPSNDGWFGSWGPPQHLGQARMRAIEEGLPVLRSTTTGVSAVIDAGGVVRAKVPMRQEGRIDMLIPAAREPTLFAHLGPWLSLIWGAFFVAISLVVRLRPSR